MVRRTHPRVCPTTVRSTHRGKDFLCAGGAIWRCVHGVARQHGTKYYVNRVRTRYVPTHRVRHYILLYNTYITDSVGSSDMAHVTITVSHAATMAAQPFATHHSPLLSVDTLSLSPITSSSLAMPTSRLYEQVLHLQPAASADCAHLISCCPDSPSPSKYLRRPYTVAPVVS